MRVRMIRPSYWTDADLHTRLTAEQREFYIGLWMQSDDAGYIAWDTVRIGAELYPYRSLSWRQRTVALWARALAPHLIILDCGKHAVIPALSTHQSPPRPSYPNQRAHGACIMQVGAGGATRQSGNGESQVGAGGATWDQVLEGGLEGKGREVERGAAAPSDFKMRVAAAAAKR